MIDFLSGNVINADVIYIEDKYSKEEIEKGINELKEKIKEKIPKFSVYSLFLNSFIGLSNILISPTIKNSKITNSPFLKYLKLSNLRKKIQILSSKELEESQNNLSIITSSTIEDGQIFIKHPFLPKTFISLDITETKLFHIKMECLSDIASWLGAKKIAGNAAFMNEEAREIDDHGKITYKTVKLDAETQAINSNYYKNSYSCVKTYTIVNYSKETWEEAKKTANIMGLDSDYDIKNLIKQRNPDRPVLLTSSKLSIELTNELNSKLDVAFNLSAVGFDLGAEYNKKLKSKKTVNYTVEIDF